MWTMKGNLLIIIHNLIQHDNAVVLLNTIMDCINPVKKLNLSARLLFEIPFSYYSSLNWFFSSLHYL